MPSYLISDLEMRLILEPRYGMPADMVASSLTEGGREREIKLKSYANLGGNFRENLKETLKDTL